MPTEKELFIKGEVGQLEARILQLDREKVGIVCHPHPQYGGSMENNVVYALCDGLQRAGYSYLRFNFRGVGRSDGFYGDGAGEARDLTSVIGFCKEQDFKKIVLLGYSFGAYVVLCSLDKISVTYPLILVSPPIGVYDFSGLKIPVDWEGLIIAGTEDYICPIGKLKRWCKKLECKLSLVEVKGTDHFYFGKESKISNAVKEFLETS